MLFGALTAVSGSGAKTAPTIPTTMKPAMSRYVLCQPIWSERTRARAPETSTPIRQPTMEAAVPAPRSSSRKRSVRYASITMSWDAEAKATKKASPAIAARAWAGELKPMDADADEQDELDQYDPSPPSAEPGRHKAVHEGGPEELERIGHADEGKDAYGMEIDARFRHPDLERAAGKGHGKARRKTEHRHKQHAGLEIYLKIGARARGINTSRQPKAWSKCSRLGRDRAIA